jgi:GrpB-like predicted nucleotidyltransferase (UPF0157 family)
MTYDQAVARASAAFAAGLLDATKMPAAVTATIDAMRVLAGGDMDAKVIPVAVADQVRRDVMLRFADALTARLRPAIERDLGIELAERVDHHVADIIAAAIQPTTETEK